MFGLSIEHQNSVMHDCFEKILDVLTKPYNILFARKFENG